jgi:hypothetical protein
MSVEIIGGLISFLLTLMVLSYLIGDNPFFRVAVYIFVGVAAGYAAAIAWWQVVWPRVFVPLFSGSIAERGIALFALILGVLLLMKISPRTSRLGNPVMAYLVGVAVAVAIAGALMGTLIPQMGAAINVMDLTNAGAAVWEKLLFGLLMLAGTITTLAYFHFGARTTAAGPERPRWINILGAIGQGFIAITLGVLFAGVFTAALTALIERISSISDFLLRVRALFL